MNLTNQPIKCSTFQIQIPGQKFCGQLSLWVLYQLSLGNQFEDIILDENVKQVWISLPLETKNPNTTSWINKAKPYFVDQIVDSLPEYDNDAVHQKYLMDQLHLIEVDKDYLKERINDVKRFFKRQKNNTNFIDESKLKELDHIYQITTSNDKITKQKIDLKQLIANINPSEDKLTALETKLSDDSDIQQQIVAILVNVVDKTQFYIKISIEKTKFSVKLKPYIKCQRRWSRIDSVFKALIVVLTVGTTLAIAITGGLMVPVLVPTVLATITAIRTSSCGLIAIGYTSKQQSYYKNE
ncbi:hypothetical protein LOTGIDRAFT_165362 [Lottia gigantea]|uniref:Uncharacterized protein n=1 Tax=Lottia gigantea TaxID=225164 RepID=V4BIW5_LOTGI|nr:hypothetical protein LOTGIDRAFT_165362 [Lottia gigantea]ESO88579.1 hypothetical protein LOTGIDRAFT_165362 [Lottia gigantea]